QRSHLFRSRNLLPEAWSVTLVDSIGARYEAGEIAIGSGVVKLALPSGLPDGPYNIEITSTGLAWRHLVQKVVGSVTIDSVASEPVVVGWPLITNFRYDIYKGWIRLLWNGDVSPADSGVVSAGIWLGAGVPDFSCDPTVTVPLFSQHSEHFYI